MGKYRRAGRDPWRDDQGIGDTCTFAIGEGTDARLPASQGRSGELGGADRPPRTKRPPVTAVSGAMAVEGGLPRRPDTGRARIPKARSRRLSETRGYHVTAASRREKSSPARPASRARKAPNLQGPRPVHCRGLATAAASGNAMRLLSKIEGAFARTAASERGPPQATIVRRLPTQATASTPAVASATESTRRG